MTPLLIVGSWTLGVLLLWLVAVRHDRRERDRPSAPVAPLQRRRAS